MNFNVQKVQKIPIRKLWEKEDKDFTKWLEKNIDYLNEVIGLDINIESREENVGPFKVDLYGEHAGLKVIIENQLEKTDHKHLGQLLTYLINLDAKIAIWISTDPVEEHKKVIDWLNETTPEDMFFYLIKLEAIKVGESVAPLFTIIKEPYDSIKQIGNEKKEDARRHSIRKEFWAQFLNEINKENNLFTNISASTDNWIGIGIGYTGVSINLVVSKKYARTELYINRGNKEENKRVFDIFYNHKSEIEQIFGKELIWERMDENVTSRIKYQLDNVNVFDKNDWNKMNKFLIENVKKLTDIFKKEVRKIS